MGGFEPGTVGSAHENHRRNLVVGRHQGHGRLVSEALDKIAVRGKQIDAATESIGVDPRSCNDHPDPGFDKEMQAMMGKEGGKTTTARDKLLLEKFGDVQKTGSLMRSKEDIKEMKEDLKEMKGDPKAKKDGATAKKDDATAKAETDSV